MATDDQQEQQQQDDGFYFIASVATSMLLMCNRRSQYISREPCRTSALFGAAWVSEILSGHPNRCYQNFRMKKEIFRELCVLLRDRYLLHGSNNIDIPEMVGMFLFTLGQGAGNRLVQECFQHSGETVSRIFHQVLHSVYLLAIDIIKPMENHLHETPTKILNDRRYQNVFQNCIGAIDGTHILVVVRKADRCRFIGRKGITTQNVMAMCDFDMLYIFVSAGWEGSVDDARVFQHAITTAFLNFPHPPEGKYYLVDAGYPNKTGYLSPYKGEIYHLSTYQNGRRAAGPRELFNHAHSSLRSVIERTFGVTKNKWPILRNMPSYSFETQVQIVIACMALHNFIRLRVTNDEEFICMEEDDSITSAEDGSTEDGDGSESDLRDDRAMAHFRDKIAHKLFLRRQRDRS